MSNRESTHLVHEVGHSPVVVLDSSKPAVMHHLLQEAEGAEVYPSIVMGSFCH